MEDNKFLINIPDADNLNHIVVFLTGSVAFPNGLAGAGILKCLTILQNLYLY